MKRKKNQKPDEELNFWQPTSDLLSALLYILMLVIVMMGLYLMYIPEYDQPYTDPGNSFDGGWDDGTHASPTPTFMWNGGWAGGGGDDGDARYTPIITPDPTPTASPTPTVSPTPDWPGSGGGSGGGTGGGNGGGDGPGDTPDLGIKSAVYVMIVDAETDRTIKEEGVQFELYGVDGALQILNSYYPEHVTYRTYETTESGTFYFPEKLSSAAYELHEMTEPEGYDASRNIEFILAESYDWPDPLVVRVPLYPSRNIIRVQMTDAETGLSIAGGSFDIIAAENISTADGTLRYRTGQTVGVITCDESGYGESEEVYLGQYLLRQHDIPQYYASYPEDVEVSVTKKSSVLPAVNTIASERTRIRLTVSDELLTFRGIEGAVLNVRPSVGQPFTVTTDYEGAAVLDELEKGATYRITQTIAADDYQADRGEYNVSITSAGRIGEDAETTLALSNRLIRAAIGVSDEFSNVQIPGKTLSLFDQAGELVHTWTTTGSAQLFTNLKPGAYYLVLGNETEHRYNITIRDQAPLQELNIHTTYVMQYVIFGAIALLLALGLGVLIAFLRRSKKR